MYKNNKFTGQSGYFDGLLVTLAIGKYTIFVSL